MHLDYFCLIFSVLFQTHSSLTFIFTMSSLLGVLLIMKVLIKSDHQTNDANKGCIFNSFFLIKKNQVLYYKLFSIVFFCGTCFVRYSRGTNIWLGF